MYRELVENWIAYYQNGKKRSDDQFSAWKLVEESIRRDPDTGLGLVLELIDAAPDDFILATIAAGPLEDLLNDSPHILIERVAIEARRDPNSKILDCRRGPALIIATWLAVSWIQ